MKLIFLTVAAFVVSASLLFSQSAPSQAAGYQLVFSENFSKFDLSPSGYGQHTWYPGIYFQPDLPLPSAINVVNSALDLEWNRGSGENNTSIEGCSYDAGHCSTFRYGYFEARMKWDTAKGSWPAFWMITKQSILGAQDVGEIDIFEGQGGDQTHYYGTVNEWKNGGLFSSNSPLNNRFLLAADNDYSQWHSYGLLWVPGNVTWYFDDQSVGSAHTPVIFDQQDFFMILGSQEGAGWTPGNLAGVTAAAIDLDVAWVHVFQPPPLLPASVTSRITPITKQVPLIVSEGQAIKQGPLPGNRNLTLTLYLPIQNPASLDDFLKQVSNPQSPDFQHYLNPEEFVAKFGLSQADRSAVTSWIQSKGLTLTQTTANGLSIGISGSVQAINQAFQITMNTYLDPATNRTFFASDQEPTLDLSVQLLAIDGLTSISPARRPSPVGGTPIARAHPFLGSLR